MAESNHHQPYGSPSKLRAPIYVWQLPVRLFHWINAVAIVILFVTGLYIGNPILVAPGEAVGNFFMGNVRYWHGITAYIFTANLLFRLYWFIVGNEYSKMRFWRKEFWRDAVATLKYYLFLTREHTTHVGHNSMAQLMYLIFIWIASLVMILTGFAMRATATPDGFLGLFSWVIPVMNSESQVRMIHHLFAWGYAAFLLGHLYMVFRQDILDDDGTVSSMINGYKYELPETVKHEDSKKRKPKDRSTPS